MVMAYATVTGRIVVPGTTTGIPGELHATPLTEGGVLAFPSEDYTTVGPAVADVTGDGTLSPSLKIPTDVPDGTLWRLTFVPKGKGKLPVRLGDYEITTSTDIADLVPVQVTSITPTVAADIAGASASAAAAAASAAEAAEIVGLPTEAAAQAYNIENDPDVRGALSATIEAGFTERADVDFVTPETAAARTAAAVNNDQIAANGLTAWKSAIANRRLGSADLFMLGHSWVEGEGVTSRDARILDRLREGLRSKYPTVSGGSLIAGGTGYLPCVSFETTWTNPWTLTGGASTDGYGIGGRCAVVNGTGQTVSITGQFCSSFDLYWLPGSGAATISIDGGAASTLPVAGSSFDVQRYSSGALGVGFHSITITGTAAGASYILGATFFENDENAGVRVWDSGHNGWQTSNWKTYTGGGGFFGNHYTKLPTPPDLVAIMCLVNDYNLGANPATTQTNLAGIIADIKGLHAGKGWANPSFLIIGETQPTSVTSPAHLWTAYLAAAQAVAAADADTEFINLSARLDTTASPQGTLAPDLLHPSAKGAGWIADVLASML